jgi:hypothetical protein
MVLCCSAAVSGIAALLPASVSLVAIICFLQSKINSEYKCGAHEQAVLDQGLRQPHPRPHVQAKTSLKMPLLIRIS